MNEVDDLHARVAELEAEKYERDMYLRTRGLIPAQRLDSVKPQALRHTPAAILARFLASRFDDDEAVVGDLFSLRYWHATERGSGAAELTASERLDSPDYHSAFVDYLRDAKFMARFDPARTSLEIASKRKLLLELAGRAEGAEDGAVWMDLMCVIALPYADHPDYDPEWRV